MTAAIQRPDIDAWRDRWESDPAVTFRLIAESAGVTVSATRGYAVRRGWCRTPEVHREMLRLAAAAGCAARYGKCSAWGPASDVPPSAVASVFDLGSGRRITTNRQHAEVYA